MFLSLGINIGLGLNTTNIAAFSGGGGRAGILDDSGNKILDDDGNVIVDDDGN